MTHVVNLRWVGRLMVLGGSLTLMLAPVLVTVKYMTGWNIVPKPFWVSMVQGWLLNSFPASRPAELWMGFGSVYSLALLFVFGGMIALAPQLQGTNLAQRSGYWLMVGGLALVIPGDLIHSLTWHQNGLTMPTPGSNPVANTAYAAHMMGMNLLMIGSLLFGITGVRRRTLARWVAFGFALVFPAALFASLLILPTTPSGALWLFSVMAVSCGHLAASGRTSDITFHASH